MQVQAPEGKPSASDVWARGLFMLLLMIGFAIGQWLLNVLAIVQFLWLLFAREPNQPIARFGNSLSIWLAEVGRFLCGASDDKPFPWIPWPDGVSRPPTQ
jgi:hypothetical protein